MDDELALFIRDIGLTYDASNENVPAGCWEIVFSASQKNLADATIIWQMNAVDVLKWMLTGERVQQLIKINTGNHAGDFTDGDDW